MCRFIGDTGSSGGAGPSWTTRQDFSKFGQTFGPCVCLDLSSWAPFKQGSLEFLFSFHVSFCCFFSLRDLNLRSIDYSCLNLPPKFNNYTQRMFEKLRVKICKWKKKLYCWDVRLATANICPVATSYVVVTAICDLNTFANDCQSGDLKLTEFLDIVGLCVQSWVYPGYSLTRVVLPAVKRL